MPRLKRSINLISDNLCPKSKWDRIYDWTFNTAKYILMIAEVCIILAFLTRLYYDGKINDTKELLNTEVKFFEARKQDEANIRVIHKNVLALNQLRESQLYLSSIYEKFLALIPQDLSYDSISVSTGDISIQGEENSYTNIKQFIDNLKNNPDFVADVNPNTNQASTNKILYNISIKLKNGTRK